MSPASYRAAPPRDAKQVFLATNETITCFAQKSQIPSPRRRGAARGTEDVSFLGLRLLRGRGGVRGGRRGRRGGGRGVGGLGQVLVVLHRLVQVVERLAVLLVRAGAGLRQRVEGVVDGLDRLALAAGAAGRLGGLLLLGGVGRGDVAGLAEVLGGLRVDAHLGERLRDRGRVADLTAVADEHAQQLREGRGLVEALGVDRLDVEDLVLAHGQGEQVAGDDLVGALPQRVVRGELVGGRHGVLDLLRALRLGVGG